MTACRADQENDRSVRDRRIAALHQLSKMPTLVKIRRTARYSGEIGFDHLFGDFVVCGTIAHEDGVI